MIFFDSWDEVARVVIVGVFAYIGLVAFLRVSGKRTLSKLNAFDLVVTVALGSTLATILLSKDVALAEGLTAFALLIGLQYVIAWSAARSKVVSRAIKSEPTLVLHKGEMLSSAMKGQRVAPSEVLQVLRQQGIDSMSEVDSVILETDGSFSIVKKVKGGEATTMRDLAAGERSGRVL